MAKGFGIGGWIFSKSDDDNSESGSYTIIDRHGQHRDYDHHFSSVDEMIDYVKEQSRTESEDHCDDNNDNDDNDDNNNDDNNNDEDYNSDL